MALEDIRADKNQGQGCPAAVLGQSFGGIRAGAPLGRFERPPMDQSCSHKHKCNDTTQRPPLTACQASPIGGISDSAPVRHHQENGKNLQSPENGLTRCRKSDKFILIFFKKAIIPEKAIRFLLATAAISIAGWTCAAKANVVYTQSADPNGSPFASQNDTAPGGFGAFATTFDNFSSTYDALLTSIQWTGAYFNGSQAPISSFEIQIYADNAGVPGSSLYSQTFTGNSNETSLGIDSFFNDVYTYSQNLNSLFQIQANTTYWLSIVPSLPFPPQWGTYTGTGGDGTFYQDFLGSLSAQQGDLAFTINGDPVPVPGPLPATGAFAAFAYSRRLRKRIKKQVTSADTGLPAIHVPSSPK